MCPQPLECPIRVDAKLCKLVLRVAVGAVDLISRTSHGTYLDFLAMMPLILSQPKLPIVRCHYTVLRTIEKPGRALVVLRLLLVRLR